MTGPGPTEGKAWDAIVVGGGVGGLTAAAYLARRGKRALLLEANESFGGRAENSALAGGTFAPVASERYSAVDRQLIEDLDLHHRGLRFVQRFMPLVVLRPGGRHLVLPHDFLGARAAIRAESASDAKGYANYRRNLFKLARRLRPHWAPNTPSGERLDSFSLTGAIGKRLSLSTAEISKLDAAAASSANAYLQRWFENESVKTALAFDATLDGLTPEEASSALVLLWRAAQECSGLQGAIGQIRGGPAALAEALVEAARAEGAILLPGAQVARIEVVGGRAAGVTLATGTGIEAGIVLSNVTLQKTLQKLVAPDAVPFGAMHQSAYPVRLASATVVFALKGLPPFAGLSRRELQGRVVVAERPESAAEAKGNALGGALPNDLVLEVLVPSIADDTLAENGRHVLTARVPYLPAQIGGGWESREEELKRRALAALEPYAPGLRDRIVDSLVITPSDFALRYGTGLSAVSPRRQFLQTYEARIRTPIQGLYLCGSGAEPIGAAAGRAGRLAAFLAIAELNDRKGGDHA